MWLRCGLSAVLACAALPAWAQEREWIFDTAYEDAYLIFGVPESEDAGISFGCTLQSGEIRMFIPEAGDDLEPDRQIKLTIRAAGKTFTYDGVTSSNQMAATTSAEAAIPADDPLFTDLRNTDRFAVKTGAEENIFPLDGADFEGLVGACGRK
ncbi:MAG: hypothetical protein AB7S92_23220 [Parvibaculaceae bacterium]